MSGRAVPDDSFQPAPDENTIPPADDPAGPEGVKDPPRTIGGTLRKLGPGLIIAGSIVGSGELIATTKTGAQAGIVLLWLILIGCVIKVFVQIELGRTCITHGITTLAALNKFPGRIGPVNWILWFWVLMMAASIAQLGGIVGGVGQSLALAIPITGDYARAIQMPAEKEVFEFTTQGFPSLSEWDLLLIEIENEGSEIITESSVTDQSAIADGQTPSSHSTRTAFLRNRLSPEERENLLALFRRVRAPTTSATTREDRLQARIELRQVLQEQDSRLRRHSETPEFGPERALGRKFRNISEQLVDATLTRPTHEVVAAVRSVSEAMQAEHAFHNALLMNTDVERTRSAADEAHARKEQVFNPSTLDDKMWATIVTIATILLLANGKYGIVEWSSTIMVVMFTFVTIGNSISLQFTQDWALSGADIWRGLSFGIPESSQGLAMALATFGIIGVGATELVTYPYWCIEKGYARFTGRWSQDDDWAERAKGWMRVMHWDALCSMVIYTIATIAFYLVGAAVLNREGRDPDGMRMVGTLASAYEPVFGEHAKYLFLIGAVAVLYSTFLVANAGHSRLFTDALKVFRLMSPDNQKAHNRAVMVFCIVLPLISLAIFLGGINPVQAVAFAGMMQATMLPMIGIAAIYWRYYGTDPRLAPPRWWDVLLIVSFVGLLIVGTYGFYDKVAGWTGWRL
jgi:Mn2+/Fe2+ NRAMP family transporter